MGSDVSVPDHCLSFYFPIIHEENANIFSTDQNEMARYFAHFESKIHENHV